MFEEERSGFEDKMKSFQENHDILNPTLRSCKTRRGSSLFSLILCISLMLSVFSASSTAYAYPTPVQTFYVSLPEDQALAALYAINIAAVTPMYTAFSIAIGLNGTLIYYDQWEDGYAADIANPTSGEVYSASNLDGVQIWGNGLAADGCAPNINGVTFPCTDGADVLYAGNIIFPYNRVIVPRVATPNSNVLDTFASQSYSRNDGNTNWSDNWVETGDDNNPASGTIYINIFSGHLRFQVNTTTNDSIDRGVSLTPGDACATLSFTLGQAFIDANEDRLAVQISSDGGGSYTTLETYDNPTDAGAKSYNIAGYATATTRVRFLALDALEIGEYWSIDNAQVGWNCSALFDGRDKIGASESTSMARMVWATGSGTLNAYAHELYPTIVWGTTYESPVGTNTSNAGQMFEYSALSIMAENNGTTVNIDANADNIYETTATLQEGESTLVTGILQGARVQANHPIQVVLLTGDIGSNYASRDINLLPTIGYGSSYWSPVGVVNGTYPTRLYLYNPSSNGSIYITCEVYNSATPTTPTVTTLGPVATRGVVTTDLANGQGAHCYASLANGTPTTDPIFAIGTIDTTNSAYDGSFTMYSDYFLTTEALVGLGLGRDPTYNGPLNNENSGPLWLTAACSLPTTNTYVYVDWNNDGTPDLVDLNGDGDTADTVDGISESTSNNGMLVTRLQSIRLFEPPLDAEYYDQSGARVWSRTASGVGRGGTPGCKLAVVWAEDPQTATAGSPGLDVATSVPPYSDTPTAVTVSELAATTLDQAIQIDWQTFSEIDILGFNLYRSTEPDSVNRTLIYNTSAKQPGSLLGDTYGYTDGNVQSGIIYTYYLEVLLKDGSTFTLEPVTISLSPLIRVFLPVTVR